jgi:hypothetical protein
MTSLCKEYWQVFLAQGVCGGLGLGILFLPAVGVVPRLSQISRSPFAAITFLFIRVVPETKGSRNGCRCQRIQPRRSGLPQYAFLPVTSIQG